MEEKLYDSDIATVIYNKEDLLAHITWKQNTDSSEYRTIFHNIVEFAMNNQVRYVLSDMRKEGLVQVEDIKWLELEVLKKAVEYGVVKIALVTEDTIFSNIYAETIKRMGGAYNALDNLYIMLDIIRAASENVGPANVDSQALYEAAQTFSLSTDGVERYSFGETKRYACNYFGIYEASGDLRDLYRVDPAWQYHVTEP